MIVKSLIMLFTSFMTVLMFGCASVPGQDEVRYKCFDEYNERVVFKAIGNMIYRCNAQSTRCFEQEITNRSKMGNEQILSAADGTHTRLSYMIGPDGKRYLTVAWRASDPDWRSPSDPLNHDDLFFCKVK
jgi:hypothetical protein